MDRQKKLREILENLTNSYDYSPDIGGHWEYDKAIAEIEGLYGVDRSASPALEYAKENSTFEELFYLADNTITNLQAENKKLNYELADIKETYASIVSEPCKGSGVYVDGDEKHCTCVPALRGKIQELLNTTEEQNDTIFIAKAEIDKLKKELKDTREGAWQIQSANRRLKEEVEDNWNLYLQETKKHEEYHNKYQRLKESMLTEEDIEKAMEDYTYTVNIAYKGDRKRLSKAIISKGNIPKQKLLKEEQIEKIIRDYGFGAVVTNYEGKKPVRVDRVKQLAKAIISAREVGNDKNN